jgi:enoyl-CoA hydratase
VDAEECLRIGLCEKVVAEGEARQAAEEMAHQIARLPQVSLRADRRSVYLQHGLSVLAALESEWNNCSGTFKAEGAAGAARFAKGVGRHGDFSNFAGLPD